MTSQRKGKIFKGRVVAVRQKTIVVAKDLYRPHPIYKKIVKSTRKLHAHDEHEIAKINDIVLIQASRRRSKLKAFVFVKIVDSAEKVFNK